MGELDKRRLEVVSRAACEAMKRLLDQPENEIRDLQIGVLHLFADTAVGNPRLAQVGEVARSVATLLETKIGHYIDEQTYVQLLAVGPRLIKSLSSLEQQSDIYLKAPLVPNQSARPQAASHEILVFTGSDSFWVLLEAASQEAGYSARRLAGLLALNQIDAANPPVAIIIDIDPLDELITSREALQAIKHARLSTAQLLVLGDTTNFTMRLHAVRLGATRYLPKPVEIQKIFDVINGISARLPLVPYRVLIVDDDRVMAPIHQRALENAGLETRLLNDPLLAFGVIHEFEPDVIVTDLLMTGCNGFEFVSVIRQDDRLIDTPIILLTADADPERRIEALNLGANDYLGKPVSLPRLAAMITAHARQSRRLKRTRDAFHQITMTMQSGQLFACAD